MVDGRNSKRYNISVQGRYRSAGGLPRDVPIMDISETGCRFFDKFGRLAPGSEISLRIGTIGPIVATVRWSNKQITGTQFEKPLYGPIFEHIRTNLDDT